jgi:phosphomannomutase
MVRFGHDGWLAELAYDLTYESIVNVALAAGVTLARDHRAGVRVVVACDRRFLSDSFSDVICRELAGMGIEVVRIPNPVPLSMLAATIAQTGAAGGMMVGGGQSPAQMNGLLLRGPDGGALPRWMLDQIAEVSVAGMTLPRLGPPASIEDYEPIPGYLSLLESNFPLAEIRGAGITVAVDSLWGTTAGLMPRMVGGEGSRTVEIRTSHNPLFPGLQRLTPDVTNMQGLQKLVQNGDATIGVALSVDGTSAAILDERGIFLSPGIVAALIAWHRFHVRKQAGAVARSIAGSSGIDSVAQFTGAALHELPCGYTSVCESVRETSPRLVFDDEGDLILPDMLMERDGIALSLVLMSLMIETNLDLSDLVAEVQHVTGPRVMMRARINLGADQTDLVRARIGRESWPDEIAGLQVLERYLTDGIRIELNEQAWLLMRYDEIDGALHIVSEARSSETASALLDAGRSMMLI